MLTRVTFAPQHEFRGPSSAPQESESLEFEYLGLTDEPPTLVEYHRGWDIQKERHARVAARETLSNDVREVITRALTE